MIEMKGMLWSTCLHGQCCVKVHTRRMRVGEICVCVWCAAEHTMLTSSCVHCGIMEKTNAVKLISTQSWDVCIESPLMESK